MERHCCFLLPCAGCKCDPGCAGCAGAVCPSSAFSWARPVGWDSLEMVSWQREFMWALLFWSAGERNTNLLRSGRSPHSELLLDKCGLGSVKYVQNSWMEALWQGAAWGCCCLGGEFRCALNCSLLAPAGSPIRADSTEHPKPTVCGGTEGVGRHPPPPSTRACPRGALTPPAPPWARLDFGTLQVPMKWWQRSDLSDAGWCCGCVKSLH